jgi:hypothetical protein
MFMGATEEQMNLVAAAGIDHVAYILILYSMAFLVFLFVNLLVHLYDRSADPTVLNKEVVTNGRQRENGHAVEDRQLRDAEEFELEGLMSDDEDEGRRMLPRSGDDERGLGSPDTIGKNSERIAR